MVDVNLADGTRAIDLRPLAPAAAMARIWASHARWAMLLDVDGTLLDIAARPELVSVPDGLVANLGKLQSALDGALAIISGRPISQIDRLLSPLQLIAAGVHGTEWRTKAGADVVRLKNRPAPELLAAIEKLPAFFPGIVVERKAAGIAIHYRQRPDCGEQIREFAEAAVRERDQTYAIISGRQVIELLPLGHSKQRAFAQLFQIPPFTHRRPIWIGDDKSDEACFPFVGQLQGMALPVRGEHFSAARSSFGSPADVRRWLDQVVNVIH